MCHFVYTMKIRFPYFLMLFFTCWSVFSHAQIKNIKIAEGKGGEAPEEPSICINSKKPKRIVAGANIKNLYYSKNGGLKWKKVDIKSNTHGVYGDPCIITDDNGDFYYFHLSDPEGKGWKSVRLLDRIVCQKSENNGKKWNDGAAIGLNHPKDQDKEWAVFDPFSKNIYVTWTEFDKYGSEDTAHKSRILFSKSSDRGKTWSTPVKINEIDGNSIDNSLTVEGAVPAVGPNGEIYVAWSLGDNIYFDYSIDQGKTWQQKDIIAVTGIIGWSFGIPGIDRCNGMSIASCDISNGANKGTIYINWSDQRNGEDNTDIWLIKSTDNGKTWSNPLKINDDEGKNQQFFTWMTIDQTTGYIYTVFYDRRNHNDNTTDVYLAYSVDGGDTFINKKISENSFVPDKDTFFGDYINISAHDGIIRPIWTHYENEKMSIWTAIIDYVILEENGNQSQR